MRMEPWEYAVYLEVHNTRQGYCWYVTNDVTEGSKEGP